MRNKKNPFQQPKRKKTLPNAIYALILAVVAIPASYGYGFPGLLFAVLAFALSQREIRTYKKDPDAFQKRSYDYAVWAQNVSVAAMVVALGTAYFYIRKLMGGF